MPSGLPVRWAWVWSFLSVAVGACASFSSADPSPVDASVDADAGTTSTPDGAAADAPPGADAAFCASLTPKPTFCADFDHGKQVDFDFTRQLGDVQIDALVARSPPASLRAVGLGALLERGVPAGAAGTWEISLSMRVDRSDHDAGDVPFYLPLRVKHEQAPECTFGLELFPNSGKFNVQGTLADGGTVTGQYPILARPERGKWTRVRLLLETQGSVTATLRIDEAVAFSGPTVCVGLGGQPTLVIGQVYGGAGVELNIDDVVFDAR